MARKRHPFTPAFWHAAQHSGAAASNNSQRRLALMGWRGTPASYARNCKQPCARGFRAAAALVPRAGWHFHWGGGLIRLVLNSTWEAAPGATNARAKERNGGTSERSFRSRSNQFVRSEPSMRKSPAILIKPLLAAFAMLTLALSASAEVQPFPSSFRTEEISTDGATIHVRIGGKGSAVVMLHGFGDTGVMWAPIAAVLAHDHTVVVPDLRGMGLSSHPEGGYDKKTQARDIAQVLDSLKISGSVQLVTH